MDESQSHDLLIVLDATSSMNRYLEALNRSLPQIVSIAALTNCFERIGILAYRDYSCPDLLLTWSGWWIPASAEPQVDLLDFAKTLVTCSGPLPDWPEAVKTGLAKAYEEMRADANTLILLYADAPPHLFGGRCRYYDTEQTALLDPESYDGHGPKFADWISAARTLKHGEKKAQVVCMIDHAQYHGRAFDYLASLGGGTCLYTNNTDSGNISETTVQILLAWMGVGKEGVAEKRFPWFLRDDNAGLISPSLCDERGPPTHLLDRHVGNVKHIDLHSSNMAQYLPKRDTALHDFSRTYKEDNDYRGLVHAHLRRIMQYDVTSISLNPVFGSLWRAVCNDRMYEGRQELLNLFGRKVDEIQDNESRTKLKLWLEESYDYTAEVLEIVGTVPETLRFPCVCLDPTLAFQTTDSDDDNHDVTTFRRDELLEIGRSCDRKILQRLGKVLTRLTFIDTADDMPAHLANDVDLIKIPLALATKDNRQEFWRILLHIVVPGTMLGRRAGALLAALSIRLGVKPLMEAAERTMMTWRDRWNNVEIPETWNISCLSLLINADNACNQRLLKPEDKALFERLIQYKMLEYNLATTLTARIGWTPRQTSMAVGTLVVCSLCKYPRSVTVMGPDNVCGICCFRRDNHENSGRIASKYLFGNQRNV